jgi:CRISPR/Cas system CMR subunit Cmr4 (Cas7 group RAMP superfamily)
MSAVGDPLRQMTGPGGVREVAVRWVITAELVLDSAAHLGNGEPGDVVDMELLRDRIDHRPLLTGSSLAGALRSHLNDLSLGYGAGENGPGIAASIFGGSRGDDEGRQSPLIVCDARGSWAEKMSSEVRDGVALKPESGTAAEHLKYDVEVLPPGTMFPLRFELLIPRPADEVPLVQALAAALRGLERGEIGIGARRSRGLGACRAIKWRARRFDLSHRNGWLAWLTSDHEQPTKGVSPSQNLHAALTSNHRGLRLESGPDQRERVVIEVELQIKGGLLVRSPGLSAASADATHLHSGGQAILPGTSVAGALRARALRIAEVVRAESKDGARWVDQLFGPRPRSENHAPGLTASRLRVAEQPVMEGQSLRQARIRGDRFTGGVVDGGLFDEEPLFRGKMRLRLELRRPQPGEVGLLLLVLKDLLTGDLPLGGAAAVGRGVVTGRADVLLPGQQTPSRIDPLLPAVPDTASLLNRLVEEFRTASLTAEAP